MKWEVVSISFLAVVVAHAQLIGDYDVDHRQLPPATSAAHWNPQITGQADFDNAYSFLIANNYDDVGGNAMVGSLAYFQPIQAPDRGRDFHVADLLSVAKLQVQGDVAKANWMETASAVVNDKVANVADPVRMKRKNILRYRNGEFRPTLCSPRLCLSYRPLWRT